MGQLKQHEKAGLCQGLFYLLVFIIMLTICGVMWWFFAGLGNALKSCM